MREYGLPKFLTWRWTPCAALTLGAASFAAFALLVIPDRIGELGAATQNAAARLSLGSGYASTQTTSTQSDWSSSANDGSGVSAGNPTPSRVAAARPAEVFPKRGFSPPLERPEPPPAPSPPPASALTLQLQAQAVAQPVSSPPPVAPSEQPSPAPSPPDAATPAGSPVVVADPNAAPERTAPAP
jgi:hypothetical protein